MWNYLNQRIATWLALIIVIFFAFFCVIVVKVYAKAVMADMDKIERALQE